MTLHSNSLKKYYTSTIVQRITKNSLWVIIGSGASRVLILVSMIFLARLLGQEKFGQFGLIQSTLGVAGLMAGLGLGSTVTRFVAQYSVSDTQRAGRIIALIQQASVISTLSISMLIIINSSYISKEILNSQHLQNALLYGILLLFANVLRGIQNGIYAGLEKFEIIGKLTFIEGVTSLLSILILAYYFGLEGALMGMSVGLILPWILGYLWLNKILQERSITITYQGCWQEWHILHGYSLPSLLANLIATPTLLLCMTWVAQRPDGYNELALYQAAYQWHGPIIFIPMMLTSVISPILVKEWEFGTPHRYQKLLFSIVIALLTITGIPILILSIFSHSIMALYGETFKDGANILILLLLAAPLHALAKVGSSALLSMNKAWYIFITDAIWALIMLSFTLVLLPKYGIYGMSISFLFSYLIASLLLGILVMTKIHQKTKNKI